jgi:type IV pilus assembly protein PilQ
MLHKIYKSFACFLIFFIALAANSAQAQNNLKNIDVKPQSGGGVKISIDFSDPVNIPKSFTTDNPARIAFDFIGAKNATGIKKRDVNAGVTQNLSIVQAGDRTRMIVALSQLAPYTVDVQDRRVNINIAASQLVAKRAAPEPKAPDLKIVNESPSIEKVYANKELQNIDFHRNKDNAGRVVFTISDPRMIIDTREESHKIVIQLRGATMPAYLERKLDVTDFGTPVRTIDAKQKLGDVIVTVDVAGDFEHLAYQADGTYTLEVHPISSNEKDALKAQRNQYSGQRLSFNFQDIEIRSVLQLIADFTGLNLVASDSVKGNITLRLQNVPWDQALDIILKSKGLDKRKVGNVIMVAPIDEIAMTEQKELQATQQLEGLTPLHSEFIQINYAKASALATLLKAKENSMLSARGTISVDERTNTLLVQDTTQKIEQIRSITARLDKPVEQVLIESRIVTATKNFGKDLGVRFGLAKRIPMGGGNLGTSGNIKDADSLALGNPAGVGTDRALNVDLPVTGAAGSFALSIAKLPGDALLDLELSALETQGLINVLSNPSVVTANQKQAIIREGTQIPYQEATSSGATSTAFKDAVLELKVTPQITPDKRIILDLDVKKDEPGQVTNNIPAIDTREVSTQVLVDNGQTIVLGGIYTQTKDLEVTKVPYLGNIPVFGALFRNTSDTDNRRELLIFVTPKVVSDSLALR